jgi:ubiquinone/menaquinone biosynthesis C-methylase UbiE
VTERDAALVEYYSARAAEYEKVYAKPERQEDLRALHEIVPSLLKGRRVLEIACGTGYWTRYIAKEARSITGCDLSPDVLQLARARQPVDYPATFVAGDAFALELVPGAFDGAFIGFWWSHVRIQDLPRFLRGVRARLPAGSRVVILDNRFVEESNSPSARRDDEGNTYQERRLEDGTTHEVLKNFPTPDEVATAITAGGGLEPEVRDLRYYWYALFST